MAVKIFTSALLQNEEFNIKPIVSGSLCVSTPASLVFLSTGIPAGRQRRQ